jgi:hypothetical protein
MRAISSCILQTSIHACNHTWTDCTHVCSFAEYMNRLHACMLVCRIHELITRMYTRLQNTWTDYTHVCSFAEYMNWLHACMLACRIHELIPANEHTFVQSIHVFSKRAYMRVISSCILQTSIHSCNQFMYSVHELIARLYASLQNTWTDYTHVCSFEKYVNWLHACMLVCRIHERIHACNQFMYSANEHTCV